MENNFATNLKFLRKSKNLSQNELANEINLTRQTISNYEKGLRQPDLFALTKISNFFSISVDELIFSKSSITLDNLNTFKKIDSILNKSYNLYTSNSLLETLNKKKIEIKNCIHLLNDELIEINSIIEYLNHKKCHFSLENSNDTEEFSEELSPFSHSNNILDLDFYKKTKIIKASNYHNIENHNNFSKLPCIGQVSAGYPLYANEDIERYFYISKEYRKYNEDDYFILKIKGESMNKLYKNGDYVLIRKTCCIDDTQPSVVLVNKEDATVKFVKFDEEYFYLQPYSNSPEFQENISYKKDENTLNIIGTVVGVIFEEE